MEDKGWMMNAGRESGEVEEEGFDGSRVLESEGARVFGLQSVARRELHATDLNFAADELEPQPPALTKLMRDGAGRRSLHAIDIGVLTDMRRALTSVIRNDEHLRRGELLGRRLPFGVAWTEVRSVRLDPDLDEMESVGLRGIILAVLHPAAGAHDLDLTGLELGMVAEAITVLDGPFQDVREDFHVAMPVGREAHRRVDEVLVDHPQGAETHVGGVMIIGETEAVPGHQPAVIGEPAFLGAAHCELHIWAI